MRHKFLTATTVIVLIDLVSGQYPFGNGFQSYSYASAGNGPQAQMNYGNPQNFGPYNQASFFSNSGSSIPLTNAQPNAAGQASAASSASFFPQINNQQPNNNFQYSNSFANPVGTQLSSADSVISSIENNPLIKQFLPDPTNINPVANYVKSSIENDPFIKPFLSDPTNINPATNAAQSIQSPQNGFPNFYTFGSNSLPNVNPSYIVSTSNAGNPSFSPPISGQPSINNFQYANPNPNPVGPQLSSADSIMSSIENEPLIKQFFPDPTNINPVAGYVMSSIENDPLLKQFFPPPANGAQLTQNSQNGFPTAYATGSNPSSNVNPWPGNIGASTSFIQSPTYNLQPPNTFVNPVGSQFSSANSAMSPIGNNPPVNQFLPGSTNPITNGAQVIQNSQNVFPNALPNGLNPSPNINSSDIVLSSTKTNPINEFLKDSSNQRQVISQVPNPLPNANQSNTTLNIPVNKQFVNDSADQQLVNNRVANPSDDVQDLLKKLPVMKKFFDNPDNLQLLNNRPPNFVSNTNPSVLDFLEKNPLVKQFLNDPTSQELLRNRSSRKPKRRNRPPHKKHVKSLAKSNSSFSTINYNSDVTENFPNGNKPTISPTVSSLSSIDVSSTPTYTDATIFPPSMRDKPSTTSVRSSSDSYPSYTLPSDVPIEYPKSDFPEGFFADMLKSLETTPKSASPAAAAQPTKRRKCKGQQSRTVANTSFKSTAAANTESTDSGPTTLSPTDSVNLFTLNNIGTINQVSDSSPSDTVITTVIPSDLQKQLTLSNIKGIDSLGIPQVPSTKKRKCKKRPKVNLVPVIPSISDLTSAAVTLPLTNTPQIASSESETVIDTGNTDQNSDLTTVALGIIQTKKKKKCNKKQVKPKTEIENSQNGLVQGQSDVFSSFIGKTVPGILSSSNTSVVATNLRSPDNRQKSRKCQRKNGRMKPANTTDLPAVTTPGKTNTISADLTTVTTLGPTDVTTAGNTKQDGATTDSTETSYADKATTVGPDACRDDQTWWDCKPLNNTCTNVARGKSQKNVGCVPGCYCAVDLVADADGYCMDPDDCPDPVCKDEDHEEITDCLMGCNRCEDVCNPCEMTSCIRGCDCKDGYKRNGNGTCVLEILCPPCTPVISD